MHCLNMRFSRALGLAALAALAFMTAHAARAADPAVLVQVQQQKAPLLQTLSELVAIESGSHDREGLDKISRLIFDKLKALGGTAEFVEPAAAQHRARDASPNIGRMVRATFKGQGRRKILLIAHMDTVYPRGMLAKQPFRIDGPRAYGLGIGDDKAGIAVILHTLTILKALDFAEYGTLTVLITGDEEIGSPGSRALLAQLGTEHDLTMSFEGSTTKEEQLRLTTAGVGSVQLKVKGRASHAGAAPEQGRNAIYELAHQILQTRDFSDPARGVKINWTMMSGGSNRNVIPAEATAAADVRVRNVADYDALEARLRETVAQRLIPDTETTLVLERGRPPLIAKPASRQVGERARQIYGELGRKLNVTDVTLGGGTDAAYAAFGHDKPVLEGFGLQAFGAHSSSDEYVLIDSIEPRLYLATRLIVDFSRAGMQK